MSSSSRTRPSSARWTRTSPSSRSPATSSCSATTPGASGAWRAVACAWRTRAGPRRLSPSGSARDRRARASSRSRWRRCARNSRSGSAIRRPPAAGSWGRGGWAGGAALGAVPTLDTIVAERFFDEAGGQQLVIHAPFGGRVNRAWGMALRKRICQSFDFELQAAATDDGVLLSLGPQHSFPLESIFAMVHPSGVEKLLTDAALQAPMFATRWRWNASRSLALLRWQGGRRVPPYLQRMRAEDLLASVFPAQLGCQDNAMGPIDIPDHPLVNETLRDCLTEAMDAQGLKERLQALFKGEIRSVARETPEPSVFAPEILNANPYAYLDDAPLE